MQFPRPLTRARLIRRYKRFLADMEFADGRIETVHCANPGAMLGLAEPGLTCYLSPSDNPARKLKWNWELVEVDAALVGINTAHPNRLVAEAILAGAVPELAGYADLRREVRYGRNSRIDMLLTGGGPDCFVEVKNVHLKRDAARPGLAEFPDSVTARGAKHLEELADMVAAGARAVMFYLVQRTDCVAAAIAADIDPTYARALQSAVAAGVEVRCYDCDISSLGISLRRALPFRLPG